MSTTHLHEFKSADKAQAPVMSLHLPEQKLGSHSAEGGSSNKFILKGRQTGTMHRGHTWVFRAESHDTMMAWYEDIKALTEKTPEERTQFVRTHSRSLSRSSRRSVSSDGIVDEDDDEPPFSATHNDVNPEPRPDSASRRPQPGGRFPSDIQVNAQRGLHAPQSPSSVSSGLQDQPSDARAMAAAAAASHGRADAETHMGYGGTEQTPMEDMPSQAAIASTEGHHDGVNPYTSEPVQQRLHEAHQDGYFVAPSTAPQTHSELPAQQGAPQHQAAGAEAGTPNGAGAQGHESVGVDGTSRTNGGAVGGGALVAGFVPKSETQQELALQSVPEAEAADHTTAAATRHTDDAEGGAAARPGDSRMDSAATISKLPMPGKFPKGPGVGSP